MLPDILSNLLYLLLHLLRLQLHLLLHLLDQMQQLGVLGLLLRHRDMWLLRKGLMLLHTYRG